MALPEYPRIPSLHLYLCLILILIAVMPYVSFIYEDQDQVQ